MMLESQAEARLQKGFSCHAEGWELSIGQSGDKYFRVINTLIPVKVNREEQFPTTGLWGTPEFRMWDLEEVYTAKEPQEWRVKQDENGENVPLTQGKYLKRHESLSVSNANARLRKVRLKIAFDIVCWGRVNGTMKTKAASS